LVARYGGEEFVVVLPNTDAMGAVYVAENIRSAVKDLHIDHNTSTVGTYVSMSLGVATVIPTPGAEISKAIDASDRALYEAKAQGRDRVVMAVA
jgi:diguanylate cyclase (GGDEF)-like protein